MPGSESTVPGSAPLPGSGIVETPTGAALGLAVLWFALVALFHTFPAIDIAVQHLFFEAVPCPAGSGRSLCGIFPLAESKSLGDLRMALYVLPFAAGLAVIMRLVITARKPCPDGDKLWILLATLCLGPGLLVNLLLKNFSGRPRPFRTDLFGGDFGFQPAGSFIGACRDNCSFVSGEAAGGMWLICAALVLPAPLRRVALPLAVVAGSVSGLMRLGFGRHYLSDVLLGGLSTLVVFATLSALFGGQRHQKATKGENLAAT